MNLPIILITGASSGIGRACALAFAGRARIFLVARRADRLAVLAAELGAEAAYLAIDLASRDAPQRAVAACAERFGGLDALVNNAGIFRTGSGDKLDEEGLDALWRINVLVPMLLARHAIPLLRARGGGHIVNISSIVAERSFPGCSAYTASKMALEGWSRVLREELRPDRIRVGVVAPGPTDTEVWGTKKPDPARLSRPEDIAAAVRFLIEQPPSAAVERLSIYPPAGAI